MSKCSCREERNTAGVNEPKTWGEVKGPNNEAKNRPKVPYSQSCVKRHTRQLTLGRHTHTDTRKEQGGVNKDSVTLAC